jgi:hypothetical protein
MGNEMEGERERESGGERLVFVSEEEGGGGGLRWKCRIMMGSGK